MYHRINQLLSVYLIPSFSQYIEIQCMTEDNIERSYFIKNIRKQINIEQEVNIELQYMPNDHQ